MKLFRYLLFLAVLLVTSFAAAQEAPPPRAMMLPEKIFIALRPEVVTELKITDAQKQQVLDAFNGSLEVDGENIRLTLNGDSDLPAMEESALKHLKPEQQTRLREVWIQWLHGAAIADDSVAKDLGLSADQKKQADALADEGGQKLAELMGGGISPDARKKIDEVRSSYGKRMEALLTDPQKKVYETMKGKPFEGFRTKG